MCRILPVLTKTVMIVFDLRAIDLMKIWRGATTHHSLLSLYSLQSLPLPAWQLCNMITPDVRILELFLSNISGKHFPHFNVTATACPWEYKMVVREGGHPRQKPFYVGLKPQNTLAKTQHICKKKSEHIWKANKHIFKKKIGTHLQTKSEHICKKQKHICKKTRNTFAKKCIIFAVFLKSLKRRQTLAKLERRRMNSQRSFARHIWIVSQVTNDHHACRCRGDNTWMGEGMGK